MPFPYLFNFVDMEKKQFLIDGLWFSEIFGMAPLNEELKTQVFDELINMIQEDE